MICGDTYATDPMWNAANAADDLAAVLVECSFPSHYDGLAKANLHLTPRLLALELKKLKKDARILGIELAPTVDILANVASRANPPFCVGFAAESERLDEFAEAKRRRKNLPLLAANLAQTSIGTETSELVLFDDHGRHVLPHAPKSEQARLLVRHIAQLYSASR